MGLQGGGERRDLLHLEGQGVRELGATSWGDGQSPPIDPPMGSGGASGGLVATLSHQEEALRAQDEGLDSLGEAIARQKRLAEAIGGEAEAQVELLDEMDDDMDRVTHSLRRTTAEIRQIAEGRGVAGDSNGKYWAVIIALLVAIIVVGCLPAKK